MPATDDDTRSQPLGLIQALLSVGFAVVAVLWWSSRNLILSGWALGMAIASGIFALDNLRWRHRRPLWANIALGALLVWLLILAFVYLKQR